jgi:hypothetical protein
MTQTQHHVRRWHVSGRALGAPPIIRDQDNTHIARVTQLRGSQSDEHARLIAAAPEMLEALLQIATANPDDVPQWELRNIAEAAISKATGAS